ncbi:hypothetical protein SROCM77S_06026 [Streptomyces rochei]|uniref:nucleoside 2-deoxyribosyltransferase domain-containing protein n=1 Tax=Streptomyces TaxID=1883 RepID=UPI00099CEBA6|nr:nucleoside 2-deoxyribosyltransferase domain-containing protein [Streptomyces sp. NRRL WC-3795]
MNTVRLVMAREPVPAGPTVFLAGPTPDRSAPVPSWRPEAARLLARQWTGEQPLTALSPESRHGERAERYEDQVAWETEARAGVNAILFWIPCDMRTMPGMTTNVECGLDVSTGRAVLGVPADCPNPEGNRSARPTVAPAHAVAAPARCASNWSMSRAASCGDAAVVSTVRSQAMPGCTFRSC